MGRRAYINLLCGVWEEGEGDYLYVSLHACGNVVIFVVVGECRSLWIVPTLDCILGRFFFC